MSTDNINIKKEKIRVFPQWFINELVKEEDKERAIKGELKSHSRVLLCCSICGYQYDSFVANRIKLKTMVPYRGCRECARKKHSEDRKKYILENYDKVVEINRRNVESQKEFYKNNPDKLIERGKKRSQYIRNNTKEKELFVERMLEWRRNNPDKVKEINEKRRKYYDDHPEKREEVGERFSKWYKDNPDKVKDKSDKYRELCKNTDLRERLSKSHKIFAQNNPSIYKSIGRCVSYWYKSNIDAVRKKGKQHSLYMREHPEIRKSISKKLKIWYSNEEWKKNKCRKCSDIFRRKRVGILADDFKLSLEEILHPEDYNKYLSGDITSKTTVKTKCPVCGNYSEHLFYNIFSLQNNRVDSQPFCKKCLGELSSSKQEKEIRDYISSMYSGAVVENSRDIIPPYELDLYYPDKHLAIEYHGAYWHSDEHRKKNLHYQKFFLCKQKGIRLISIFSQDWLYKRDKIELILNGAFSELKKIYARDCDVVKIEKDIRKEFLDKYHFNGDSNKSLYSYGLLYKDILLAVVSFGKLRGQNPLRNKDKHYELLRMAFRKGYSIIGGFSKLISHFKKEHQPNYILTYSDNDFFLGNVYASFGFSFVSNGEKSIDYQWVKYKSVLNRYSCTVETLLNKYPKYQSIHIDGSVEDYIMKDLGYSKVYRCGNSKWEWRS